MANNNTVNITVLLYHETFEFFFTQPLFCVFRCILNPQFLILLND